jgi:murein DD-endopeptidase MepM/ murein hydrolase activator NlpD
MQVLITHGRMARTRVLNLSARRIVVLVLLLATLLMLTSGAVYHFVFLKAAREGWPLVSPIVRLVVRDEIAQRDRFMRENLDAIAQKVGEMQAKLVKLEAMGERVSGMAGVKAEDLKTQAPPAPPVRTGAPGGSGGPYVPVANPTLDELQRLVAGLDAAADHSTDVFTLIESRLLETRLASLMIPNSPPVDGSVGSGFGFRADPFTGRSALHTGLDFPGDVGTPIHAAAGGLVLESRWHPEYGQLVEIDHGNGLSTRYAHCSKVLVAAGALVKRGQRIALIGNSGRSTGPHLHFEVLLDGVPQDPARFLAGGASALARAPGARRR